MGYYLGLYFLWRYTWYIHNYWSNNNLVKVKAKGERRVESLRVADIFRARVIDSSNQSFVFELTGSADKLDAFIKLMQPLGLVEVSRTGAVAILRGEKALLK